MKELYITYKFKNRAKSRLKVSSFGQYCKYEDEMNQIKACKKKNETINEYKQVSDFKILVDQVDSIGRVCKKKYKIVLISKFNIKAIILREI